jgi:hypothetical protein
VALAELPTPVASAVQVDPPSVLSLMSTVSRVLRLCLQVMDRVAPMAQFTAPGMRYVAFNYTNTQFGFYGIDDLTFERDVNGVPEPGSLWWMGLGLAALTSRRKPRPPA